MQCNTIYHSGIQYNTMQYRTKQGNSLEHDPIYYNKMHCYAIKYHTIKRYTIPCKEIRQRTEEEVRRAGHSDTKGHKTANKQTIT